MADAQNYKANLRITQQHGTSVTGLPGSYSGSSVLITPTSISYNATAQRWEVVFPVTGFSGFFANSGTSNPLPVRLLSFSGRAQGSANELSWTVAGEEPGTVYTVERGTNGADFATIGTVEGTGSGAYRYSDANVAGTACYRLCTTSGSGEDVYSAAVLVRRTGASAGTVMLAPQPTAGILVITNTDATLNGTTAVVLDVQGREVARLTLAAATTLDVSGWAPGLYALHLASGDVLRIAKH